MFLIKYRNHPHRTNSLYIDSGNGIRVFHAKYHELDIPYGFPTLVMDYNFHTHPRQDDVSESLIMTYLSIYINPQTVYLYRL